MDDPQTIIARARAIERTEVPLMPDETALARFLEARVGLREALLRYDAVEAALTEALRVVGSRAEAAASLWATVT